MAIRINHKDNSLQFNTVSAPATPPAGTVVLYFDNAGQLSFKDEAGDTEPVGATGDLVFTSDVASDTINSTKKIFNLTANDSTGVLIATPPLPGTNYSLANIPVNGVDPQISVTYSAIATASGFYMTADGTKAFYVDNTNTATVFTDVYTIPLSTPFDLATAGVSSVDSVTGNGTAPAHGITFDSTGLEMYISKDTAIGSVEQFTLTVAFDPSTATYSSSALLTAQNTFNFATRYNADGTKAFKGGIQTVIGTPGQYVDQYTLSPAYDLTTAGTLVSFDVSTELTHTSNYITVEFSNDGWQMFVAQYDDTNSKLVEYALGTPYDVSTAGTPSVISVAGGGEILSMWFSEDGYSLYWLEAGGSIYQYDTDAGDGAAGLTEVVLNHNNAKTLSTTSTGVHITGNLDFSGADALLIPPVFITSNFPTTVVEGGMIYDSITKTLKFYDGSQWNDVGGDPGDNTVDNFVDGVDYTSGTSTQLTLSKEATSENNISVYFDGIVQHHTEYSLAGTTLTFSSAIPTGTTDIEVIIGIILPLSVPSTDSVVTTAIQDGAVTDIKLAETYVNADGTVPMSGDLAIEKGNPDLTLIATGAADTTRLRFQDSSGFIRGLVYFNDSTDAIQITRADAAGATETTLTLSNDGNVSVNAAAPSAVDHLTRKNYVDDNFTPFAAFSGGDLDTLITDGVYDVSNTLNFPGTWNVGTLVVTVGGVYVSQHWTNFEKTYMRRGTPIGAPVWSAWSSAVNDAGDTMTGTLNIGDGTNGRSLIIKQAGSSDPNIKFRNTSDIFTTTIVDDLVTDELIITKIDPAAGPLTTTTLKVELGGNVSLSGGTDTPLNGDHLTRKDYVDAASAITEGGYNFDETINSATIPVGLSRIYNTSVDSPTGAWANGFTVKSGSTRGFQIGIDDSDADFYWRNQDTNGTLWNQWESAVKKSGDTMSGALIVRSAEPQLKLRANISAANTSMILVDDSDVTRGELLFTIATNDLAINRYALNTTLETSLTLTNNGNVSVSGALPTDASHLTRKDYVDTLHANRNVIINGNMDIWQRGTSFAAIVNGDYTTDRFQYANNTTVVHTALRSTDVPTYAQSGTLSNYSLHLDVTTADASIAAGDVCGATYLVEGYDYARIAGGDATLSFWVNGAKTGIHCVSFRNSGFDRSYIAEYTIAAANTWEKVEITVPLTETAGTWDYINGTGIDISFMLAVGSTFQTTKDTWQTGNFVGTSGQVNECDNVANNFHIAQVQFERGDAATPFEYKNYQDELQQAQRYYWRGELAGNGLANQYGAAAGASYFVDNITFPTTLRSATPTYGTITSPTFTNCSSLALVGTEHGMTARVTVTALGTYRAFAGVYDADAEL